jgi:cell wall assembly regulator SMI1
MIGDNVDRSWQRILTWLAVHAPAIHAAFREPNGSDLDRARHVMSTDLPSDLVSWWQAMDGVRDTPGGAATFVPPWFRPYSIAEALDSRESWLSIWPRDEVDSGLAGSECRHAWLPDWLPIANNGSGNDLFVDLRPGPLHGCLMEFDRVDGAEGPPLWPSVAVMLADIADALETGSVIDPFGGSPVRAVLADGGGLQWMDASSD